MNDTRIRFGLTRPSRSLDPRTQAMRGDLADVALAGRLFAPHYAAPVERAVAVAHAPMFKLPGEDQVSELLIGERFALLDIAGGWAWGYSLHDHYVGYIAASVLTTEAVPLPTIDHADPVDTAKTFIDMPYLWGGRGGAGIDCSGLMQRSFASAGVALPRDSDMQHAALTTPIAERERRRGDLVFFPGHVGILCDENTLLHATRFHSRTVIEPLADVVARNEARSGAGILGVRRVTI